MTLSDTINNHDHFYMMSDDNRKYISGKVAENTILNELNNLGFEALTSLYNNLSDYAKSSFIGDTIAAKIKKLTPVKKDTMRSKLFSAMWSFIKAGITSSKSEALTMAWKRIKLLEALKAGVAYFSYIKANGEHRDAIGTLREGNYVYRLKGARSVSNIHVIKYFDLVCKSWRSLRVDRLIGARFQ